MRSPRDIANTRLEEWYASIRNPDNSDSLLDFMEMAVQDGLDTIDGAELASQLKRAENDRKAWMEKSLLNVEVIKSLELRLSAMTIARDDAVAAAHLIHQDR